MYVSDTHRELPSPPEDTPKPRSLLYPWIDPRCTRHHRPQLNGAPRCPRTARRNARAGDQRPAMTGHCRPQLSGARHCPPAARPHIRAGYRQSAMTGYLRPQLDGARHYWPAAWSHVCAGDRRPQLAWSLSPPPGNQWKNYMTVFSHLSPLVCPQAAGDAPGPGADHPSRDAPGPGLDHLLRTLRRWTHTPTTGSSFSWLTPRDAASLICVVSPVLVRQFEQQAREVGSAGLPTRLPNPSSAHR